MNAYKLTTLAALIGLFLFACNPAKRAQRLEDKLVDKAAASRSVLQRLQPIVTSLWPCANDSTGITSPGGVDSFTLAQLQGAAAVSTALKENPVKTPDFSLYVDRRIADSLQKVCREAMGVSFANGYAEAVQDYGKIKIPVKRPDTVRITVLDKRSIELLNIRIAQLQGQNQTLTSQSAKDRKAMIIAIVIGSILLVVVIYLLIRKII